MFSIAFYFANHALWYVVMYPSMLLMCAIKANTKVDAMHLRAKQSSSQMTISFVGFDSCVLLLALLLT